MIRSRKRVAYFANYKLYPHEVVDIFYMVNEANLPRQEIADAYGISASHVSNIGMGRFWQELFTTRQMQLVERRLRA